MPAYPTEEGNTSATGTLGALNAAVTLPIVGYSGVGCNIPSGGTLVATVLAEQSFDGGSTWLSGAYTINPTSNIFGQGFSLTNPNVAQNASVKVASGATHVRLRVSAYTSGTAIATIFTSDIKDSFSILMAQDLSPFLRPVICNTAGNLTNEVVPTVSKATYATSITRLTVAATATDIFSITGSATKTVKITNITVSAIATAAGVFSILFIKRSAANTGGTSTTPTIASYDSTNASATAVVRAYTVNPTALGAAVGTIQSFNLLTSTTTGSAAQFFEDSFGLGKQPIVLRGVAEVLAINLNSITITGGAFNIAIEWIEE